MPNLVEISWNNTLIRETNSVAQYPAVGNAILINPVVIDSSKGLDTFFGDAKRSNDSGTPFTIIVKNNDGTTAPPISLTGSVLSDKQTLLKKLQQLPGGTEQAEKILKYYSQECIGYTPIKALNNAVTKLGYIISSNELEMQLEIIINADGTVSLQVKFPKLIAKKMPEGTLMQLPGEIVLNIRLTDKGYVADPLQVSPELVKLYKGEPYILPNIVGSNISQDVNFETLKKLRAAFPKVAQNVENDSLKTFLKDYITNYQLEETIELTYPQTVLIDVISKNINKTNTRALQNSLDDALLKCDFLNGTNEGYLQSGEITYNLPTTNIKLLNPNAKNALYFSPQNCAKLRAQMGLDPFASTNEKDSITQLLINAIAKRPLTQIQVKLTLLLLQFIQGQQSLSTFLDNKASKYPVEVAALRTVFGLTLIQAPLNIKRNLSKDNNLFTVTWDQAYKNLNETPILSENGYLQLNAEPNALLNDINRAAKSDTPFVFIDEKTGKRYTLPSNVEYQTLEQFTQALGVFPNEQLKIITNHYNQNIGSQWMSVLGAQLQKHDFALNADPKSAPKITHQIFMNADGSVSIAVKISHISLVKTDGSRTVINIPGEVNFTATATPTSNGFSVSPISCSNSLLADMFAGTVTEKALQELEKHPVPRNQASAQADWNKIKNPETRENYTADANGTIPMAKILPDAEQSPEGQSFWRDAFAKRNDRPFTVLNKNNELLTLDADFFKNANNEDFTYTTENDETHTVEDGTQLTSENRNYLNNKLKTHLDDDEATDNFLKRYNQQVKGILLNPLSNALQESAGVNITTAPVVPGTRSSETFQIAFNENNNLSLRVELSNLQMQPLPGGTGVNTEEAETLTPVNNLFLSYTIESRADDFHFGPIICSDRLWAGIYEGTYSPGDALNQNRELKKAFEAGLHKKFSATNYAGTLELQIDNNYFTQSELANLRHILQLSSTTKKDSLKDVLTDAAKNLTPARLDIVVAFIKFYSIKADKRTKADRDKLAQDLDAIFLKYQLDDTPVKLIKQENVRFDINDRYKGKEDFLSKMAARLRKFGTRVSDFFSPLTSLMSEVFGGTYETLKTVGLEDKFDQVQAAVKEHDYKKAFTLLNEIKSEKKSYQAYYEQLKDHYETTVLTNAEKISSYSEEQIKDLERTLSLAGSTLPRTVNVTAIHEDHLGIHDSRTHLLFQLGMAAEQRALIAEHTSGFDPIARARLRNEANEFAAQLKLPVITRNSGMTNAIDVMNEMISVRQQTPAAPALPIDAESKKEVAITAIRNYVTNARVNKLDDPSLAQPKVQALTLAKEANLHISDDQLKILIENPKLNIRGYIAMLEKTWASPQNSALVYKTSLPAAAAAANKNNNDSNKKTTEHPKIKVN